MAGCVRGSVTRPRHGRDSVRPTARADAWATERRIDPGEAGMEPGSISVTRTLPIDGALLGDVLLRLRRDAGPGPSALDARRPRRGRGRRELHVDRHRVDHDGPALEPDGSGVSPRRCARASTTPDDGQLTLDRVGLTRRRPSPELLELAHAAVDELAEELLWHATRRRRASHAAVRPTRIVAVRHAFIVPSHTRRADRPKRDDPARWRSHLLGPSATLLPPGRTARDRCPSANRRLTVATFSAVEHGVVGRDRRREQRLAHQERGRPRPRTSGLRRSPTR